MKLFTILTSVYHQHNISISHFKFSDHRYRYIIAMQTHHRIAVWMNSVLKYAKMLLHCIFMKHLWLKNKYVIEVSLHF